jgi:threonine dehydrogenase-like Zn-dependent dehydrogenase
MLAVHLENGAVTTREIPLPHRPRGFALLRLLVGGICNTDLELQRGYYNFAGTPGNEITLVGSGCGRFEAALPLLGDERIRLDEMIADCFPLHEAAQAFERAAQRGVLKVLLG